ncbi:hypothetical protein F5B22DRAFT_434343 [Xylaria bambusicola]|uniref:uncharacterized protein n=1 Tax=Xylaria bambusicola TaxID=326684 RepID=UPI00200730ED|nr:uncharacterized protein F5B22DRAFT_434343 [Xylaria bambusicola]KAI0506720.1 hypothetical protein F5B22DRAFT_434343 [Xylaria bambusicola]
MSKAYLAAKEKYQAVLDDAGRRDYYCRTNRFGAGRHPSSGECNMSNKIDHPERRRSSASSAGPVRGPTMRDRIREWMNRPAY